MATSVPFALNIKTNDFSLKNTANSYESDDIMTSDGNVLTVNMEKLFKFTELSFIYIITKLYVYFFIIVVSEIGGVWCKFTEACLRNDLAKLHII